MTRRTGLPRSDTYKVARVWPDRILATRCEPVVFEAATAKQRRKMDDLCRRLAFLVRTDPDSVGMSAPQIGVPLRVIAFKDPHGAIYALVNPEITERSDEEKVDIEGCFSLPDYWRDVRRSTYVRVRYLDRTGEPGELEAEGFAARILQHEIDHLDGVTIRDRGEGSKIRTRAEVVKMIERRRKRAERRTLPQHEEAENS